MHPKHENLPPAAYECYNSSARLGNNPTSTDMLQLLHGQAEPLERVFLIVDGLDECRRDGDTSRGLIDALQVFLPYANMMFTSRGLDPADFGLDGVVPVCLEHAPDVTHFVEIMVQCNARQHDYSTRFSTSDMSTIVAASAGTRQVHQK
jgi:hypothetical protein